MINRLIDARFEALERVGDGVLFHVFKARDKNTSRIVAIKIPFPQFAHDAAFVQALRDAMAPVTRLAHPNIARLEEMGDDEGTPFLVNEFVRGINLKERIRRIAPFTLSVAVDFAIAIGEALQHAHSQGFVHGDLRSHNIIVSPEGAVKVTDFGVAPVLAASPDALAANAGRSVSYQAPEAVAGHPASVGADIYALGAVLFEMLTGGLPYPGDTPDAIALRQKNDPVPSPKSANPGVPKSVEGITMKALMKRPEDRYRSGAEMLTDLKLVRDALRFGKPLSWSPLEPIGAAPTATQAPRPAPFVPINPASTRPAAEPGPAGVARMFVSTSDDRISPYLKAALYAVTFVLIAAAIGFTAFWMATFAKPPEQKFPELKGMKVADARRAADQANVRLLVHEGYNENVSLGVIYQVDQQAAGRSIRPGRSINIWVSKGSKLVYVPDLTNLTKDEAERKIKDAGLTLGAVNREYNPKVPFDSIISQNPRSRKRVDRDLAVNLSISDGPKPDDSSAAANTPEPDTSAGNPFNAPSTGTNGPADMSSTDAARADEAHPVNLTKRIPRDKLGSRRVRIEYDDARGNHKPIDEPHDEGETVTLHVDSYGPKITVRVYYGDDEKPVSERTMTFPKP